MRRREKEGEQGCPAWAEVWVVGETSGGVDVGSCDAVEEVGGLDAGGAG